MKKNLVWFAVMLVSLLMAFSAASAATMTMPDGLKIIDVEAFYGDKSISTVVLPSGITEIRARAFANSALREINLPASLTLIADDALPSPTQLQVTATKGTYAYEWAGAHGYLLLAPVQNTPVVQNDKIEVSWGAVQGAVSYTVYYGESDKISYADEIRGITGTKKEISDLSSGTVYYIWVKAVNNEGASIPSDRMSATTLPSTPVLKDLAIGINSITLNWDTVKGAAFYYIYYNTENDFANANKIKTTKNSYKIENLETDKEYFIWSGSFNGAGKGMRTTSPLIFTTAIPLQKDPKPYIQKLTVNWEQVEDAESYKVYYGTSNDISKAEVIDKITGTSRDIGGLEPGTTYFTWVKAVTVSGEDSKASNMKQALTFPAVPELKETVVSGNTVRLSWDAVPSATSYNVSFGISDQYAHAGRVTGITDTTYTITGMEFSTPYYIWMEAFNSSGGVRTPNANVKVIKTADDTETPKQNDSEGGQEMVTVHWSAVNGAESYNVYYGTTARFAAANKISDVKETSRQITGLKRGTTYYTWVTAVKDGEESVPSNRKYVITYPEVAVLKTPVVSGNSVTLNWSKATGATKYYLKYGTSSDVNSSKNTVFIYDTTYTIPNLAYDTTYYIWIVSCNASGYTRYATFATATTGAAP